MKKSIFAGIFSIVACGGALASDGGVFTETENYTNHYSYNFDTVTYYAPAPSRPAPARTIVGRRVASSADLARPCPRAAAEPVRVKTHTEVIDHYQVYQPVTVYEPVGTYTTRRVVEVPHCNRCNG